MRRKYLRQYTPRDNIVMLRELELDEAFGLPELPKLEKISK